MFGTWQGRHDMTGLHTSVEALSSTLKTLFDDDDAWKFESLVGEGRYGQCFKIRRQNPTLPERHQVVVKVVTAQYTNYDTELEILNVR